MQKTMLRRIEQQVRDSKCSHLKFILSTMVVLESQIFITSIYVSLQGVMAPPRLGSPPRLSSPSPASLGSPPPASLGSPLSSSMAASARTWSAASDATRAMVTKVSTSS